MAKHCFYVLFIVRALECDNDSVYLSVFKHNSETSFNQQEESFSIEGHINRTRRIFIKEAPLITFRMNHTYEYCLPRTVNLVYDLVLKDTQANGWDDGAYVEVRGEKGFLLFMGSCLHGKEETYRIRSIYSLI